MQRLERALEAGAVTIEPIHDDDPGQAERAGLGPELLGLYFDARDAIDNHHRRFDHAERRARVGQEVRESRGVDDVDFGFLPLGIGEAG